MIEDEYKEICMAKVQWFENPIETAAPPGQLQLWCVTLNKPCGPASFIPVTRIKQVCVTCKGFCCESYQ